MNTETAGSRLKKIRQEKGLSLEEVQKKTRIHLNILRAIEGDSISDLSPIYLKGFIKIYCASLNLDPKEYTGSSSQPSKPVLNATVGRPIGERAEKKASFVKDTSIKLGAGKPPFNYTKIIIIGVLALAGIFLAVNLIKFVSGKRKIPIQKVKVMMPASLSKKTASGGLQAKQQKGLVQGVTVGIYARQRSWVDAKVDGKTVLHGMLERGRNQTLHAKEKIELSLGDAGAIELQVNDERFPSLGRRGKSLKNILITKDGLKTSR